MIIEIIGIIIILLLFLGSFYYIAYGAEGFTGQYKLYNVSLCCIIKNERYLEEFIIYHKVIGVEHFYIYDNESSPPIKERLNQDFFKECCTIIDFPGKIQQLNAYNNCLNTYGKDTNWLIIVDGDEYLLPKKHNNIQDFLKEYDNDGTQAIGINWIMFGSSFYDKIQDGFLVDKYRYCNRSQDQHIKTICKPEFTIEFPNNPHSVSVQDPSKYIDSKRNVITGPFNKNESVDIIQINHYHGKSIEEQKAKQQLGTPDKISKDYVPTYHTENNDIKDDLLPNKYLDEIVRIYNNL